MELWDKYCSVLSIRHPMNYINLKGLAMVGQDAFAVALGMHPARGGWVHLGEYRCRANRILGGGRTCLYPRCSNRVRVYSCSRARRSHIARPNTPAATVTIVLTVLKISVLVLVHTLLIVGLTRKVTYLHGT
ncbi:hypothetical protein PENSPDRAFT_30244 [Peniophora sp. CONT]|nr:hypothetical protein PENSPDRAFT_30244 [Peniophora sp. CONT]